MITFRDVGYCGKNIIIYYLLFKLYFLIDLICYVKNIFLKFFHIFLKNYFKNVRYYNINLKL
jgi:hypothetical protein